MKIYSEIQKSVILRLLEIKNENPNLCWMSNFIHAPSKFDCLLPDYFYISLEAPGKAIVAIKEDTLNQSTISEIKNIDEHATVVLNEIVDLIKTLEADGFITLGQSKNNTPFLGDCWYNQKYTFADILPPDLQKEVFRIANSTITVTSDTLQKYVNNGFRTTEEKRKTIKFPYHCGH